VVFIVGASAIIAALGGIRQNEILNASLASQINANIELITTHFDYILGWSDDTLMQCEFVQILQFQFFTFRLLNNYRNSHGKLTVSLWR
jgi:muramoyltetrapeptide carboxypeptidase LdcA involved in peptidoglycan recycling